MKRSISQAFRLWVPFGIVLTVVFLSLIVVSQHIYRQDLNDPQIQLAEDAAALLRGGGMPDMLMPNLVPVDVGLSLAPWMALYDREGTPLKYSAVLHDAPPDPPKGLFDDTTWTWEKVHDFNGMKEMRVTWQDEHGSRQALVMIHVTKPNDQFIVVGRNMREVEARISDLSHKLALGWAFSNLVVFGAMLFI